LTSFFQHYKSIGFKRNKKLLSMAPICMEVCLGVISGILDREFESIETSSGFAQLLGENWVFQMMSEKSC
jgi:hypothetical protein